jgi:hypothetical protein
VYVVSTVTWKSTDGGKTWTGFRGAPGGDDYQNIWINPNDPQIIILTSDQGAIVTVNGGQTWSSWYNQPTAQLYHVNADNAFPYRLCSGQQESGSVCISSRGNDGEITFRDWHPVAAEEYGYVVPDPLDPDIVFGGKLTRYDRRTAQAQNIIPVPLGAPDFRVIRTEPIVFSPFDPHLMYFAANTLWATRDGGRSWKQMSPDLTRKTFEVPATVGIYSSDPSAQPRQRGVIYALALSEVDRNRMWAGTDDGLIWLTTDGGAHWNNITPPQLSAWQKVSVLEASHTDPRPHMRPSTRFVSTTASPHLSHARFRQDLDGDHQRHSGEREREFGARRSQAQGAAVRRNRARRLPLLRRWRSLAVAAAEHAGHVGSRPAHQGQRLGRGDTWPRLLDPRRHHSAASVGRQKSWREMRSSSLPSWPIVFAGTPTLTRRCRRIIPRGRILRTARFSTIT